MAHAVYSSLEDACLAVGIRVPKKDLLGVWLPTSLISKSSTNDTGRVYLFKDQNGGIAFNWQSGERALFFKKGGNSFDPAWRNMMQARMKEAYRVTHEDLVRRRELAAQKAAKILDAVYDWMLENAVGDLLVCAKYVPLKHLKMKGHELFCSATFLRDLLGYMPHGSKGRELSGIVLVLPVRHVKTGKTVSLQFIDDSGNKSMLPGGAIKCNALFDLKPEDFISHNVVGVAEGWATARSVEKMRHIPCFAALSCGNLKAVATTIYRCYPWLEVQIYGDKGNGESDAIEAANAVGGDCFIPNFDDITPEQLQKHGITHPTDWNDFGILHELLW